MIVACGCTASNGVCTSTIGGVQILDPVTTRTRSACSCLPGVSGPQCNIFNGYVVTNPTSFTFPFNHNNHYDTVTVVPRPGFSANYGTYGGPLYSYTSYQWNTDPTVPLSQFGPAPLGFSPVGFQFQIQLWLLSSGVVIPLQELQVPMRASIPWDHVASGNPWRFELFYWNVVEGRWVQAIRNCVGQPTTKRDVPDNAQFGYKNVNTDGTVSWDIYQATATYVLFQAAPTVTYFNGTNPVHLKPAPAVPVSTVNFTINTPQGAARVPEITTGVTGILPLPPIVDPGNAPGEVLRQPIEGLTSAASRASSSLLLVLLALVYLMSF